MRLVSEESTSQSIADVAKELVPPFPVTIFGNTVPPTPLVELQTGKSFFFVIPYCHTVCMNITLSELSKSYPGAFILFVIDSASWHKSKGLEIPQNIQLVYLTPATHEMNPIEQIWAWLRLHGFRSEVFKTLADVSKDCTAPFVPLLLKLLLLSLFKSGHIRLIDWILL